VNWIHVALVNMKNNFRVVGSEVLTAVVMKCSVFWAIMPFSPLKVTDVSEEYFTSILRVEE
jgi:hypothetical protein